MIIIGEYAKTGWGTRDPRIGRGIRCIGPSTIAYRVDGTHPIVTGSASGQASVRIAGRAMTCHQLREIRSPVCGHLNPVAADSRSAVTCWSCPTQINGGLPISSSSE